MIRDDRQREKVNLHRTRIWSQDPPFDISHTPGIGLHKGKAVADRPSATLLSNNPQHTTMSYGRPLPSHLRQASISGSSSLNGQSPVLLARINEKKAELENLKQLRDLSAGLAGQMQMLEEKLATLSDGTEGIMHSVGTLESADSC